MRINNKILKIVDIKFPSISFLSNNGEYRKINIKSLFKKLGFQEGDFGYEILVEKDVFNKAELVDFAIAWKNVLKKTKLPNKRNFEFFFHLDPIITIENSVVNDKITQRINYGRSIRELRKHILKITQEELGKKIGTDKQYISKVENYKTDLELKTLRKIYEAGLNKELLIAYYDKEDPINSFTNSVFNFKFLDWANKYKNDLELIEGIGSSTKDFLITNEITNTHELSRIKFEVILKLIEKRKSIIKQNPDTWVTQAKLIDKSDWLGAIKLQRRITSGKNSNYSKIESLARKQIKEDLYLMQ